MPLPGDGGSEDRAKKKGEELFDDGSDFRFTQHEVHDNPGTTYSNDYTYTSQEMTDNPLFAYQHGGSDYRDYMYGRTPTGADEAVNKAWGTGDAAAAAGGGAAQGGANLLAQRTGDAQYFNGRQTGLANANLIGNLEMNEGPSAAQAQLQAGTDKAAAQQLMLARSGRGLGGNAGAMGLAQTNLAGIDANQATSAASLRAQETADWRRRQASNMLGANNQILQSQAQNDAMVQGMTGMGQDAYFRGQGVQQQGFQNSIQGQTLGSTIRQSQANLGQDFEDNQLRAWAAQNGYDLAGQQRADQQTAAGMQMAGTIGAALIASSDIRAKKNIAPDEAAGEDFGRGLDFDGTIYRPREQGGYDPSARQGFRGASAMPERPTFDTTAEPVTPMQAQYFGADDFPHPDVRQPDTDALDASAQDAVRKAPGSFYDYKDPAAPGANDRRNYGPMAQDLAKTPAGSTAVVPMPNGKLGVDTNRLSLVNTGALSAQQKQLDDLKAQLDALHERTGSSDFAPDFNTRYGVGGR